MSTQAPVRKPPISHLELTPKQEKFAHLVVEYANYSQAYREAYDAENMAVATVWREAYALTQNPKVSTKIAQLKAMHEVAITPAFIAERMTRTYENATTDKQHSAAVKALDLAAKVAGLYHDQPASSQTLIQVVQTFQGLSTEELRAMLRDAQDARSGTRMALEAPAVEGEYLDMGEPTTDDEGEAP